MDVPNSSSTIFLRQHLVLMQRRTLSGIVIPRKKMLNKLEIVAQTATKNQGFVKHVNHKLGNAKNH